MRLELTRGYFTEVDEEDFEWASQWNWHSLVQPNVRCVYAVRGTCISGKDRRHYLHRELWLRMGNTLEHEVDHRNRDALDNRRDNLRAATHSQNQWNKQSKGYSYDKVNHKWLAQIQVFGKKKTIGRFNTEEDAAKAVKEWRLKLHGEFSCV